jgi:hypothetical protein
MKSSPLIKALLALMVGMVSVSAVKAQGLQLLVYGCQCGPEKGTSPAIQIEVDSKLLEVVKSWDKTIWLFTSKDSPLKSLDGLQKKDIAMWGAELFKQVEAFYKALGIKDEGTEGLRVIGTGNRIFSGMKDPPRLFITWSGHESELPGAIRIELKERKPSK